MKKNFTKLIASLAILSLVVSFYAPAPVVEAAALTDKSDTITTLTKSTVADHTVLFTTPTGVAAGETITLTLDSDFSVAAGLDFDDLDLSFEAAGGDGICDTGDTEKVLAAAASGETWGAVRTSATVITFTSATGTIAAGAEVCVEVGTNAETGATGAEQITNATSAGSFTLAIGGTQTDSGSIEIQILDDDSVAVTSSVAETLTFAITDVAIGFGTITSGNARFATGDATGQDTTPVAAHTMTAATNATSGYTVTYNGATLTSGSDTVTVATVTGEGADGTPGTEQFAIGFTTDGDATITASYLQGTPNYNFVASTTTSIITESGPTATETFSAYYLANIAGNTEAGSYNTSITYIATANF